jgi:hypothetical protein
VHAPQAVVLALGSFEKEEPLEEMVEKRIIRSEANLAGWIEGQT